MRHYLTAKLINRIFMESSMSSSTSVVLIKFHLKAEFCAFWAHVSVWQLLQLVYPMKSVCCSLKATCHHSVFRKLLVKYVYGDDVYTQTYNFDATWIHCFLWWSLVMSIGWNMNWFLVNFIIVVLKNAAQYDLFSNVCSCCLHTVLSLKQYGGLRFEENWLLETTFLDGY